MCRKLRMMNVSGELCWLACLILTVDLTLGLGPYKDMEFTFLLSAGSTECFYQTTARNDSIEVEYQVIAGSGLDVGFVLVSPSGYRLASDFRKSDAIHMVDPTEDGDYRLCFDNSFSKLSEKLVFFEVIINRLSSSVHGGQNEWADVAKPESMVEEDIRVRLNSVHQHLEKSRQVLTVLRTREARDRYLLEDNLWRVSFWSCLNVCVMLTVAVTQIYTLRRLFDVTRRVCT
ncbi:transmembrane emp24 domain-containing protein 1-like [Cebidichthys violaceus]|uniref:transmembrane emp24 domain-containing protein 1-like n=1 Tax=Cebidichthys violaceus TaxID=271503 RepID=UPI0035CB7BD6